MVFATVFGLLTVACGEKETTEDSWQDTTNRSFCFIPVDQWLPGTMWVPRLQYSSTPGDDWSWIQFRWTYDESRLGTSGPGEDCMDTLTFDDRTYSIFGKSDVSGEYSVVDSVVHLGVLKRAYQISADSMLLYGWHDCSYTQEMQIWLFTKIR